MEEAVGRGGYGEAVAAVEVASVYLGSGCRQRGGGRVRAGQANDLVSRFEKLENDGAAHGSGGSGGETRMVRTFLLRAPPGTRALMSVRDITVASTSVSVVTLMSDPVIAG